MAKDTEKKTTTQEPEELSGIRKSNILGENAILTAMEQIQKEKDEEQAREAKIALCAITYYNAKQKEIYNKSRREDHILEEKLDASKKLFERYIGYECTITKEGKLEPDKKKKIADDQRLTAVELRKEKDKLNEEVRKKISESDKKYSQAISELRESYEGKYRWYDTWD
jgi:hypothetical protein